MHLSVRLVAAFLILFSLSACRWGRDAISAPGPVIDETALAAVPKSCLDNYVSTLAVPADAGLSPRADLEAEQLSFEASCTIAAPEPVYQRVTAELTGIRALYPVTQHIHATAANHYSLLLELSSTASTEFQAGTYHDWDALNGAYGAHINGVVTFRLSSDTSVDLSFRGNYNTELVRRQYALLPNVTAGYDIPFTASALATPQDDVCLSIDHQSDDHYFLFEENLSWKAAVRVDADGNIFPVEPAKVLAASPAPQWYTACLQWIQYVPPPPTSTPIGAPQGH